MIKLILNEIECDLNGGETIAVTYECANDFKFHANNSVEISLPKTSANLRAIENNNILVNDSTLPYDFMTASCEVDGIDMKIDYAMLIMVSDVIKIRLYGGNITFIVEVT